MAGVNLDIVLLGIVSFLTDVSSEMIFSILAVFLTVILGASAFLLGLMEGLADFSSSSLDFVSGYLSDKTGKRKVFALSGYSFSTLAKVILVFARSAPLVVVFRVVERLGKSVRGPPRDALISSISTYSKRGVSFGIHKAFDKAGAVIGPLIAYFILDRLGQVSGTFTLIFMIAIVPAALSVFILSAFVKDRPVKKKPRLDLMKAYRSLGAGYKHYLRAACIFSLAYFSFAFLLLKSYLVGFELKDVALLYALFNLTFVLGSVPVGRLGDRVGRKWVILLEYAIYLVMSVGFALAATKIQVIGMFVLYGIFFAIDEGQSKAYISDLSTKKTRATAIGVYNFVTGLIYLPASLVAGALWIVSPAYAFWFASLVTLAAAIYFMSKR